MIPDYHLFAINRCRLWRSPRSGTWSWLWSVTYWWSCVAYSGLLKVAKAWRDLSLIGEVVLIVVANRQERGCGCQHRECSRVFRISGRTNGRRKRSKSGSNTSVVPVSYSCRTKIVQTVLDRQRSGVKATIWWFCHDHDRSGRSSMIGNIGKEWSAQCDLGFTWANVDPDRCGHMASLGLKV